MDRRAPGLARRSRGLGLRGVVLFLGVAAVAMTASLIMTRATFDRARARRAGDIADRARSALTAAAGRAPAFDEVAAAVGVRFVHDCGATGEWYFPEIMGGGCGVLDYDSDGDLDLIFVQSGPIGAAAASQPAAVPRLYRNDLDPSTDPPRLQFTDVTAQSGLSQGGYGMGVAAGDYDNDGRVDLFLSNFGQSRLFRNRGDGAFDDVTEAVAPNIRGWATSASFSDIDADGDLDLFICFYADYTIAGDFPCRTVAGDRDYCGPSNYPPGQSRLYRNDGDHFVDITESAGMLGARRHGLGVACADLTGDGRTDIFVANDGDGNQLWVAQADGKYADHGLLSGTAVNETGVAEAGMGVDIADADGDGDEDIFITHLTGEHNTLYAMTSPGVFEDHSARSGLAAPSLAMTGFGTAWLDYDHDGLPDLFVTNGAVVVQSALRQSMRPFAQRDQLFRGTGGGRFEDVSAAAGAAFAAPAVGRGAALGDLDNDGDPDIVASYNHGPARVLLNRVGQAHPWLRVRLIGRPANRDGIGAMVAVEDGRQRLMRRVRRDGSYLSANDARVHFGLTGLPAPQRIAVQWPGGGREWWPVEGINREYTLTQGSGRREGES